MFYIYRISTIILFPFIYLYLYIRKLRGKEDQERFVERLGKTHLLRPKEKLVWIHAASVGEAVSMLPMMHAILESDKSIHLLLTTGTVSSANLIENRLPDRAFHQYVPVDIYPFIKRFLAHWRPDMAIWVESELWPNLIVQTSQYCPIILINARMSDTSYQRWQHGWRLPIAKKMLSCFALTLPQNKDYGEKFTNLGAKNVKFVGNLKFDSPSLPSSPKEMGDLVNTIGQRKLWVAASTHPGEEEIIIEIHQQLKERYTDLLTIIIPRHAKRGKEILALISDQSHAKLRSSKQMIDEKTNIYIADTMGELGIFYRLASIVFIGGSLVEHGGQNPLEAARLECAILFGPHMFNFSEVAKELIDAKASIQIADKVELMKTMDMLLGDYHQQEEMAQAGKAIVEGKTGLVSVAMREIKPFLSAIQPPSTVAE